MSFYMCSSIAGGRGHLIEQPQWVTALVWPGSKGMFEGRMGLVGDCLLVGRLDGTIGVIDMIDTQTYRTFELDHCRRRNGEFILPVSSFVSFLVTL